MSEIKMHVRLAALLSLLLGVTILLMSAYAFTKACEAVQVSRVESPSKIQNRRVPPAPPVSTEEGQFMDAYPRRLWYLCRIAIIWLPCNRRIIGYDWFSTPCEYISIEVELDEFPDYPRAAVNCTGTLGRGKRSTPPEFPARPPHLVVCSQGCREAQQGITIAAMELAVFQIAGALLLFCFHGKLVIRYPNLWIMLHSILLLGFAGILIAKFSYSPCYVAHFGVAQWSYLVALFSINAVGLMGLIIIMFIFRAQSARVNSSPFLVCPSLYEQSKAGKQAKNNDYTLVR